MSQVAQLRLHALVKQRNESDEKRSMLQFQRKPRQLAMLTLHLFHGVVKQIAEAESLHSERLDSTSCFASV